MANAKDHRSKVILQLIESWGPGGAETIVADLCKGLADRDYHPIVGLLKDGWLNQQLLKQGIETITIKNRRPYDAASLMQLVRIIRERNVSVIHSHEFMMNFYGTMAARLTRRPIIATIHGKNYYHEKWRRRMAYRAVSNLATKTVAVSQDLKNFIAESVGISENRISVIHNGIDISRYETCNSVDKNLRDIASPVIGAVGNLYPVKGHIYLLKAARKVIDEFPTATFILIGKTTEYMDELKKEIAETGIEKNVRFLGFREDIPELLSLMDIFVAPSLSEGISLAILQAMAAGKPVIATKVGGTPEIINSWESGILVPPEDSDSLSENIGLLLRDKNLADKLGCAARMKVRKGFSVDSMINEYISAYEYNRSL